MIFVTVGTQLPFDRLIEAMDAFASKYPQHRVIGQVGKTGLTVSSMTAFEFMPPADFTAAFEEATVVVAHAGTGSILAARQAGKPLIVVPRRADRGEHRSDHQMATCRALSSDPAITIVEDPSRLERAILERLEAATEPRAAEDASRQQPLADLRAYVRDTVWALPRRVARAPTHRVLAVSSTGGHLSELVEVVQELTSMDLVFVTTRTQDRQFFPRSRHFAVRENSLSAPWGSVLCAFQLALLIIRIRPDVVVSTGAAPGFLAALIARITGAKAIWIDSFANADKVSLAGRMAKPVCHRFLVQWPQLAGRDSEFRGAIA